MILSTVIVLKCSWLSIFRLKHKNILFSPPIVFEIRGKLTFAYVCIFTARSHDQKYICIKYIYVKANIHLVLAGVYLHGCIFAHVQINFYIYAIAFTCPKIHPGANCTYMYNLHTVCKSAHVNGAKAADKNLSLSCIWFQVLNYTWV